MLKREITFTNYLTEEEQTDVFYFNLTKTEITEMEASYEGGITGVFQRIIETRNPKELLAEFQKFILLSYGMRSDTGVSFVKSDELCEDFRHHAAFDALFMELAQDAEAAGTFFMGVLPKDVQKELADVDPTFAPPPPPAPPTL